MADGRGSAQRFDHFVERRLYGPEGFYTSGGGAGRRRDFLTSPEVGPLFGEVMVNACHRWWQDMDCPVPFTVIDLGSGPGTLLRSMEVALRGRTYGDSWRLIGVDRAGPDAGRRLPEDLAGAVVIGNELLDNVPFRVVEMSTSGPLELYVQDGEEILRPAQTDDAALQQVMALPGVAELPNGSRLPVLGEANDLVTDILVRQPGCLCLIDYGELTTAALAVRGGWLRSYRGHTRIENILGEAQAIDITTDVALDQLPPPQLVETQADFLADHGLEDLVEEGRAYWRRHAANPDVAALGMRSRISESEALVDPSGLGSWLVAIWRPPT